MKRRTKGTPAWYRKKCDDLWKLRVRENAGDYCEKCGKPGPGLHAHHHIPRGYSRLAFDVRNGVCLCYRHHLHWAHIDIEDYRAWFKAHRPKDHAFVTQKGHRRAYQRTLAEWEDLYAELSDLRDEMAA